MPAKTEVYSWRMSTTTKARLEELARRQQRTVAQLLDEIVADGLDASADAGGTDDDRQRELHRRAARFAGAIAGDGSPRSENVAALARARLERRRRAR
jgi:hypothetical protein